MDWTNLVLLGLFVVACVLAAYQSWTENWAINRKIGAVIFLTGATVGVFFDDLLATDSSILPWIEPVGAVIMIVGLLVSWFWTPEQ